MKIGLLALLLSLLPAAAQVPTGHFEYAFTNPPLWDISGNYQRTSNYSTVTLSVAQYADGLITGTRTEIYDNAGDHGEGSAAITGRVIQKQLTFGIRDQWRGTLYGTYGGVPLFANVTAHDTVVLVPSSMTLQGEGRIRICYVGGKCVTAYLGDQVPLLAGMDGTWSLAVDTTAVGNKLSGSAVLTLSNGRSFSYEVQGTFNDTRQTGVLRLAGISDALKTYLILTVAGQEMALTKLRGRVLGQTLRLP